MEAMFFKNTKAQPLKSSKPITVEETKSSRRGVTANGDAKVSQTVETSDSLAVRRQIM